MAHFPQICCDRVAAGMTMNCQQIAYIPARVLSTLSCMSITTLSLNWLCQALGGHNLTDTTPGEKDKNDDDWGNNNGMPNAVIVLHKLT